MFPTGESVVIPYLNDTLGVRATAELENGFPPPVNHVMSLGFVDDGFRVATYQFDVDSYAATREAAESQAMNVLRALHDARGQVVRGAVVTSVNTSIGPRWIATDRTDVRRFGATYAIGVHYA